MTEAAAASAEAGTVATTDPAAAQAAIARVALEGETAKHPGLAKYVDEKGTVDPNVLAKGYIHAQSLIGLDKIVIPKDGDNEGWAKAYDALGRPKAPAEYDFKPVQLPDGMEYDTALEDKFRPVAHNLGLSQKQALGMRDWFAANQGEMFTATTQQQAQARETATNELKRELGSAYEGTQKAAEAALLAYAGKDAVEAMKKNGMIDDPFMIRVFGKIGRETLGEDKLKASGATTEDAPEQLKAKITAFRSQHSAALYDKTHIEHQIRVDELTALTTRLHGDTPVQS